jgi:hypothetical protein
MPKARIKITTGEFSGLMLLDGRQIRFTVRVHQFGTDAEFEKLLPDDPEIDTWTAYRALETWVDDNMRG